MYKRRVPASVETEVFLVSHERVDAIVLVFGLLHESDSPLFCNRLDLQLHSWWIRPVGPLAVAM